MIVRIPVLAIAAGLLAASPAAADWPSEPVPGSAGADDPGVVVAGDGAVAVAWRVFEPPLARLFAARRSASGGWSTRCRAARNDLLLGPVPRGRSRWLAGVLDARGRHRLGMAVAPAGRCASRVRWLAGARRIASPVLDAGRRGHAVLAWYEDRGTSNDRVMVALRGGRGPFRRPVRLATGRVRSVTAAISPRGDVLVAWEARGRVRARFRRAGARRFGRAQTIRSASTLGARLDAAVAPTGDAVVGWTAQRRDEGGTFGPVLVQAAVKPAGRRRFRTAQRLERFTGRILDTGGLRLGVRRDGGAVAAWTGADGIRVAGARAGGRFEDAATLESGAQWRLADLVVDASGTAGVLWEPEPGVPGAVRYALRGADGGLAPSETVAAEGHGARLSLARTGPLAVWIGPDGLRLGGPGP